METTSPLLLLPRELRDNIWFQVFGGHAVIPFKPQPETLSPCLACETKPPPPEIYHDIYLPLLTCKQINTEASKILCTTSTLHIEDLRSFRAIYDHPSHPLRTATRSLVAAVHPDDDNRVDWMTALQRLPSIFPSLEKLTVHNHMRPPMGYDALIDAIHLAGPLVNFPPRLSYPNHTSVKFAYIMEHVMFENAFLGVVLVSDALEEHRNVICDLLVDEEFAKASKSWDLHLMTNCLLRIARQHEQPWFEALQRRRRESASQRSDGMAPVEGAEQG